MTQTPALSPRLEPAANGTWRYVSADGRVRLALRPPVVELDGEAVVLRVRTPTRCGAPTHPFKGVTETRYHGTVVGQDGLSIELVVRVADGSPVVRFRYALRSDLTRRLTKRTGVDHLAYLAFACPAHAAVKEVRFATFNEQLHSFMPEERALAEADFDAGLRVMGPMLCWERGGRATLVAYEHGSQVPDAFVQFRLAAGGHVELSAVKGTYTDGQLLAPEQPYETLWLHVAAVGNCGEAALAAAYRDFVLHGLSPNHASRTPYIFYNTWNFQERNKWWNHKAYLADLNETRMLAEIDVAHRMGIDVFVIDTGWYEKTGDWRVSAARFPNGMGPIKARLDAYGMKLGLWFNPVIAAVSSHMHATHRDCLMSWKGKVGDPHAVWETDPSQGICLVSRYWEAFADELIRLVREVGVTYFKWDAIGQYGCDDPNHLHGTAENTPEERAQSYGFQLVQYMGRVIDKLCAACPEAIVDFDITEGGRCVGLGFLASGKFFLINNGPYFRNLDQPHVRGTQGTTGMGNNVYVYPGPARPWVCRPPLAYDKWLPSVLFLTHYLPDDPADSQLIGVGSLVLGHNGIWGDLCGVSDEGVARIGRLLGFYKQVRDDVTSASPVRSGPVGGDPEVHEKINAATGRGVVVLFASARGTYRYVTSQVTASAFVATEGVAVTRAADGRAVLEATFERPSARLVFFGVVTE
jgi:alpha-galactosidase